MGIEVPTTFQKRPQHSRISRNIPQATGTFHKLPEHSTRYRNIPQATRTFHKLPEHSTTYWNIPQASWSSLVLHGPSVHLWADLGCAGPGWLGLILLVRLVLHGPSVHFWADGLFWAEVGRLGWLGLILLVFLGPPWSIGPSLG